MEFIKPILFSEALQKLGSRTVVTSGLDTEAWRLVPVALRERAFFSAEIESARFLQLGQDTLEEFASSAIETLPDGKTLLKAGSRSKFIEVLQQFAVRTGLGPLRPQDAGTIKDIRTETRLGLIFDTQTRQAADYGFWQQGQDLDVLDEFPAQRFIRVTPVSQPRGSHAPFEGEVRLKSDVEFWTRINADFGVPWGPWGWGCGHDVEDVDRLEAEARGLIAPGERARPVARQFNEGLRASVADLKPGIAEFLRESFGDQVEFEGGEARWKGR